MEMSNAHCNSYSRPLSQCPPNTGRDWISPVTKFRVADMRALCATYMPPVAITNPGEVFLTSHHVYTAYSLLHCVRDHDFKASESQKPGNSLGTSNLVKTNSSNNTPCHSLTLLFTYAL